MTRAWDPAADLANDRRSARDCRRVVGDEAGKDSRLGRTRHQPEHGAGPVQHGIGERHPPPTLVIAGDGHVDVRRVENGITRNQ